MPAVVRSKGHAASGCITSEGRHTDALDLYYDQCTTAAGGAGGCTATVLPTWSFNTAQVVLNVLARHTASALAFSSVYGPKVT